VLVGSYQEQHTIFFVLVAIFVIWSLIRGCSAAAFQAAADGQAAVALPEAGDELMIEFTKADYEAVSAAIREAEKRTSGQIVCVLAHSSSGYAYVPILWASVLALAAPWPLIDFTQWSVQRIFALQLAVFILAGFLFSWMPLRLALAPRPIRRLRAHRAALEQFVVRRVTHTRNRSGILIFVSMAEHYARVIADEGIAQKVHQAVWQAAVNTLIEHIRNGRVAAGFVAAIEHCGAVLAAHVPPDGSANELPDRLYVI
jgi:putative membrane protein